MVETEQHIVIETSDGARKIEKEDIIHFPEGLPGFEEFNEFVVFDITGCQPFKSMLSVRKGGPDFIVVDPSEVFENYEPLQSQSLPFFPGESPAMQVATLSIVTLTEDPADSTVNLRGPIIIDLETRRARQVVLTDDSFSTREPLMST